MRLLVREGQTAETAKTVLAGVESDKRHEFWPDDIPFSSVTLSGVIGHRQVTDAYLAQLARHRSGCLATFDKGLAETSRRCGRVGTGRIAVVVRTGNAT